jgi:hypothetical protein
VVVIERRAFGAHAVSAAAKPRDGTSFRATARPRVMTIPTTGATASPAPPITARHLLDAERDAWRDLMLRADPRAIAAAGVGAHALGGATVLRGRAAGPLLNRAYDVAADAAQLAAIRALYEDAGVPLYFLYIDGADRAASVIERAGLVRYRRGAVYLARELTEAVDMPVRTLEIGPARADELPRATEIFCAAFDADRALAPVFASVHGAPGWHFLVARAGGEPIALGILYVSGATALLFGGATSPRFRQRGAQAALVATRVALARELGCARVGAHTGEPVPDDPQHSFHNMSRAGLVPVGRMDSYAPAGIVWTHGRKSGAR